MARNNRNFVDGGARTGGASGAPLIPQQEGGVAADIHDPDRVDDDSGQDDERLDDDARDRSRDRDAREFASREGDDRALTEEELSDDERIEAFKNSVFNSALPPLPKELFKGFHLCWLTTANPRDPIAGRIRLGYQLIRVEEVPGFEHSALKLGDYAGYIGVNEMLAAKIPLRLYHAYMQEAHHKAPLAEEERLKSMTQVIAEEAERHTGKAPILGDGTAALGKGPPRGRFAD